MNKFHDLKCRLKFINHVNKIYFFFTNLKNIDFNVDIKTQIKLLENLKNDILKFLSLMEYYNLYLSFEDLKFIYLINYNSKDISPQNKKNSKNLINCSNKIINHINNFDSSDNFCLLKTLNRFNRFKYELIKWKQNYKFDFIRNLISKYTSTDKFNNSKNIENQKNDRLDIDNYINIKNNHEPNKYLFWFKLKNDLKLHPPNVKNILFILNEILSIIFTLLKNNKNLYIEIEKNINILELKKNFDTFYFINGLDYLLHILKLFHNKKYNNLSNSKQKFLKNAMINGTRLDKFVPNIIKYLLDGFYTVLIEKNEN